MLYLFLEMAFLLGGFTEEGEGPKFMGPYPINEELINDPSFMDFARAAGPFMMPGIYQKDYDVKTYFILQHIVCLH